MRHLNGYVDVDSQGVSDPATSYKNTNRLIGNIIWSPIARIDLGAQLLQIQLSAKHRY